MREEFIEAWTIKWLEKSGEPKKVLARRQGSCGLAEVSGDGVFTVLQKIGKDVFFNEAEARLAAVDRLEKDIESCERKIARAKAAIERLRGA